MTLPGHATTEGTATYRERFRETAAEGHFRFEQNLWLSSVGIGTYLGDPDEETDRAYADAITRAVELGANVIDTAANYRFQRSERSVGEAIKSLTAAGFGREELVVCTKGGYIPFDTHPPAGQAGVRAYVEETFVKPGVIELSDIAAGSHCMTPRYLAHQVAQSLRNMSLETIDVYYVHNPETQLQVVAREEFDARLRAAFEQLERERADGSPALLRRGDLERLPREGRHARTPPARTHVGAGARGGRRRARLPLRAAPLQPRHARGARRREPARTKARGSPCSKRRRRSA